MVPSSSLWGESREQWRERKVRGHRDGLGQAQQPQQWLCREWGKSFMWTTRKTEGLRAPCRESGTTGKIPGTGLGSPEQWAPESRDSPGAQREERRELQQGCSGDRLGSTKGTYSPFLPFCTHLASGFYQKTMDTLSLKCCFLTYMHMVQDQGVLSAITFFWKLMEIYWAAFWYKHQT